MRASVVIARSGRLTSSGGATAVVASLAVGVLMLLVFAVAPALAAPQAVGTLSVEGGVGVVTVRGTGVLVGRVDRGEVMIVDLTPQDQWSPRINGVPRGRTTTVKGRDVTYFIPGGRYRIVVRGDGISLSARGAGYAVLKGSDNPAIDSGTFSTGDSEPRALGGEPQRAQFGGGIAGEAN